MLGLRRIIKLLRHTKTNRMFLAYLLVLLALLPGREEVDHAAQRADGDAEFVIRLDVVGSLQEPLETIHHEIGTLGKLRLDERCGVVH